MIYLSSQIALLNTPLWPTSNIRKHQPTVILLFEPFGTVFKSKTRHSHSCLTKTQHWSGRIFCIAPQTPILTQSDSFTRYSTAFPRALFFRIPLTQFSHQTKTSAHYPLNRRNSISSHPLLELAAARPRGTSFTVCFSR